MLRTSASEYFSVLTATLKSDLKIKLLPKEAKFSNNRVSLLSVRVCSFKVPFLRVRELLYCFVCMPLYGWKSTWEEASPKAEETGQVMHLLLASSFCSLPFLHVWTCSLPSFPSPASLIESPNPEHHLSTTSVVSFLPIPDLWAYLTLSTLFSWVSCSCIHYHNLVTGGPCSL